MLNQLDTKGADQSVEFRQCLVRLDDDLDSLEFLQVRVSRGGHSVAQRPNKVGNAASIVGGTEQDRFE